MIDHLAKLTIRFATFVVVLLAVVYWATAQETMPKSAIPDEAAQKTAATLVSDVYKPDYEKAKTSIQKVELAKKLLKEGAATNDDPVARFVLFRVARDIAAQQGDLTTALDAIGRINREFDVNAIQMQVDAAATAAKTIKQIKDHQSFTVFLVPLIDGAVAADQFDHAKTLTNLAVSNAKEGRDAGQIKQLTAKSKEIDGMAANFEQVREAIAILHSQPADSAANFAVGKYRCLTKGDWRRGLAMLALGSDADFKSAALLELDEKPNALNIADAWWKIAERLDETAKIKTQLHAGEWYLIAVKGVSGLTKAKVESRLAEINVKHEALVVKSKTTKLREEFAPDAKLMNGHYYKIFWQKDIHWDDAAGSCKKMGGYLACLNTDEERKALASWKGMGTKEKPGDAKILWVGAVQKADGSLVWLDGSPVERTFINSGLKEMPINPGIHFAMDDTISARNKTGKNPTAVIPYVQGFICEWDE